MGHANGTSEWGPAGQTAQTIPLIDAARGIAILYVMAGHARAALALPEWPWAQVFWNSFTQNAIYGVSVFFVVSGFLITRLIDQGPGGLFHPDFRWFYSRRVGRIVPLWTFTLLLGAFLSFACHDQSNRFQYCIRRPDQVFDFSFWLSFPSLCFNWFDIFRSRVSGFGMHWSVMWSLAVEEQFYLFYPWFLRRLGTIRRLVGFLAAMALAGPIWRIGTYVLRPGDYSLSLFASFSGFDQISLGALSYLGLKYGREKMFRGKAWNGAAVSAGLALLVFAQFGTATNTVLLDRIYGVALVALGTVLCLMGLLNLGITEIALLRPLAWPGRYSYGLYLFHSTTLYFLHPYIRPLPTWEAFPVYVVVSTCVAALSFNYFEVPCNHWVRRWFGKKQAL